MKNCILIPAHLPKTNCLMHLLHSLSINFENPDRDFHILLATSNHNELRFFSRLMPTPPMRRHDGTALYRELHGRRVATS